MLPPYDTTAALTRAVSPQHEAITSYWTLGLITRAGCPYLLSHFVIWCCEIHLKYGSIWYLVVMPLLPIAQVMLLLRTLIISRSLSVEELVGSPSSTELVTRRRSNKEHFRDESLSALVRWIHSRTWMNWSTCILHALKMDTGLLSGPSNTSSPWWWKKMSRGVHTQKTIHSLLVHDLIFP